METNKLSQRRKEKKPFAFFAPLREPFQPAGHFPPEFTDLGGSAGFAVCLSRNAIRL